MSSFTPIVKVVQSTDGMPIYSDAIGDPTKPSIVFIHGLCMSGACFDNLFTDSDLLAKFYLVRYDLRGHGRSGKPTTAEGYTSSLFANDFAAVSQAYSLSKSVIVGWSYGATILCDICTHLSPLPISGAVALSGGPHLGPLIQKMATQTLAEDLGCLTSTTDAIAATTGRVQFIEHIFADPTNVPFSIMAQWIGMSVLQSANISTLVLTRQQDTTKLFELAEKGFPLFVLGGTKDKLVKSDVVAEEMKIFKDLEVFLVEGGSHSIFYDNQEETVRKLTDFVLRVATTA